MNSKKIYLYVESTKVSLSFSVPCTLYLGRDEACEVYVNDRKVSRKHAEILGTKDAHELHDLGSTNGTFLNEKKIKKVVLNNGDTIRIGMSKIGFYTQKPSFIKEAVVSKKSPSLPGLGPTQETVVDTITGNLDGKSLLGLYRFLNKTKDTGTINLQSKDNVKGFITIEKGNLTFAKYGNVYKEKALARIHLLTEGNFLYTPGPAKSYPLPITNDLESLIAEIDTDNKEYSKLIKVFDKIKRFKLNRNMKEPLKKLSNEALDILQLVIVNGTLDFILDTSPLKDTDTLKALSFLHVSSFIVAG